MTYQMQSSFDGNVWYQLEWNDIDFHDFNRFREENEFNNIEELSNLILTHFPESNFKYDLIEKPIIRTNISEKPKRKRRK